MDKENNKGQSISPLNYSDFITIVNQKCSNERKWLKIKAGIKDGVKRKTSKKTKNYMTNTAVARSQASGSRVPTQDTEVDFSQASWQSTVEKDNGNHHNDDSYLDVAQSQIY
jgi:hypothetical protein